MSYIYKAIFLNIKIRGGTAMKTKKLTSMLIMLIIASGVYAQGEFVDDIYFSSSKSKKPTKSESVSPAAISQNRVTTTPTSNSTAERTVTKISEMDIDAYNRRYSGDEAAEDFSDDAYYYEDDDIYAYTYRCMCFYNYFSKYHNIT
jgi:hypothetical protein